MSIPTGHTVPYGYRKHCKLAENILKPEYWYQEQQLKPAAKPLIKKSKTWFSVNCWPLKENNL
jgi:hypothetical protein